MNKKLHRSKNDKIFAGVCGGLAEYFEIDATIIRLLFILIVAFGGSGILIYLLLWLVMPKSQDEPAVINEQRVKEFAQEIREKAQELKSEFKKEEKVPEPEIKHVVVNDLDYKNRRSSLFGWVLIVLGVVFLFNSLAPMWMRVHVLAYWPLLLIIFGFVMVARKQQ